MLFCVLRHQTDAEMHIHLHILATEKRKKWRCSLLFWTSLLPTTTVFQERNLEALAKNWLHNIWEISSKPCTQDASTFLLMATKFPGRLRPTKAWNRAALWVPFCIPFIPMTLTNSWPCREVLPLPWIQFRSLFVIMLMTLLSLQTQLNVYSSS